MDLIDVLIITVKFTLVQLLIVATATGTIASVYMLGTWIFKAAHFLSRKF